MGTVAAIDKDPATAWVSNSLEPALGQWLQVDFDRPVTNATLTITPSATAVGAQVRRIQVSTVNGTTTLGFDKPGEPLTVALPYGETPWVRVTAVGTDDDGSSGVQFAITDLSLTQYVDASGFAHPVDIRHTVLVPAPPAGSPVAAWDLGLELLGRDGCAGGIREAGDGVHLRGLDGGGARGTGDPEPHADRAVHDRGGPDGIWVRASSGSAAGRSGGPARRGAADGPADLIDIQGSGSRRGRR